MTERRVTGAVRVSREDAHALSLFANESSEDRAPGAVVTRETLPVEELAEWPSELPPVASAPRVHPRRPAVARPAAVALSPAAARRTMWQRFLQWCCDGGAR